MGVHLYCYLKPIRGAKEIGIKDEWDTEPRPHVNFPSGVTFEGRLEATAPPKGHESCIWLCLFKVTSLMCGFLEGQGVEFDAGYADLTNKQAIALLAWYEVNPKFLQEFSDNLIKAYIG